MTSFTESRPYRLNFDKVRDDLVVRYHAWSSLLGEVEGACRGMQHAPRINGGDLRHVLVATLFARTIQHVAAATILIERGLKAQSRVMLRAGMESLFSLAAVVADEKFATRFLAADQIERRKLFNKSKTWTSPGLQEQALENATDERLAEIEAEIERQKAEPLRTDQIATVAGMQEWYTTAYAVFSQSVHSNIRDLQRHIVVSPEGDVAEIANEPELEALEPEYLTGVEILLTALQHFSSFFAVDTEELRTAFHARKGELHAKGHAAQATNGGQCGVNYPDL
jgi:hypothetical protein